MILKGDIYKCHYTDRSGMESEEGIFKVVKITQKVMTLAMEKKGFFCQYEKETVRKIPRESGKRTRFCPAITWYEDNVTIYHRSMGIPFTYEKVRE